MTEVSEFEGKIQVIVASGIQSNNFSDSTINRQHWREYFDLERVLALFVVDYVELCCGTGTHVHVVVSHFCAKALQRIYKSLYPSTYDQDES